MLMLMSLLACKDAPVDTAVGVQQPLSEATLAGLNLERIKADVDLLTDDGLAGRIPGSVGHAQARDHLLGELQAIAGIEPLGSDGFLQVYPSESRPGRFMRLEDGSVVEAINTQGQNLVALLPGTDPSLNDEYIVVMAHYDHLGVTAEDQVFNGAFDNAAGAAAALELVRVLVEQEVQLSRSIVLVLTDDEEFGLKGAQQWLADSPVPTADIVFGISLDPFGRGVLTDYRPMILAGFDRSPALADRWRDIARWAEDDVALVHRAMIPNLFASDQDNFFELDDPRPAAWVNTPGMSFYHTVNDTGETIDYRVIRSHSRFLLQALTHFARDDERFDYVGEVDINLQHAADVMPILVGIHESAELTDEERTEMGYLRDDLQRAIDEGDIGALGHAGGWFANAVAVGVFGYSQAHPGPVPPPWPEE